MAKTKKIKAEDIIDAYMSHILENGEQPKNMYLFSQKLGIKESALYDHFASFEAIEQASFVLFFNHTVSLLEKDTSYNEFDSKNKVLSFYYTYFEILRANRTYVMSVLDKMNPMHLFKVLSNLKIEYIAFIDSLEIDTHKIKEERLEKIKERSFNEVAWKQFVATLFYWMKDTSPSFEKTDIFIEKSLNASFDLINIQPIESIIDFGKFLIKEKLPL